MRCKAKWIIGCIAALILTVFSCLYFIPRSTPIDITLDAVKYDSSSNAYANELGTVQIRIHGTLKEYLFRDDTLTFTVDDFDHLYDIHAWDSRNEGSRYVTTTLIEDAEFHFSDAFQTSSTVTGEGSAMIRVIFRNDLKKWELFVGDHIFTDEAVKDDPSLNLAYRATIE